MFALFGTLLARLFTLSVLEWVAWRALLLSFGLIVLPYGIELAVSTMYRELISVVQSHLSSSTVTNYVINLVSVGAWIGSQLNLDYCLSLILSSVSLKFVLKLIPFVRL